VSRAEEATLSRALIEGAAKDDHGGLVLPTLRYVYPSKPHNKSVMPKPLTKDQLAQNGLFSKECQRHWRDARREVRVQLGMFLAAAEKRGRGLVEAEDRDVLVASGLRLLGVAKLASWVEEDLDFKRQSDKRKEEDKVDEAKRMHAGFVREKNARAIRMSQSAARTAPPPAPRFTMAASGAAPIRPRFHSKTTTTVDMMRGAGMSVVHSLSRAGGADMEASRLQLLQSGFVHPTNLDAGTALEEEKRKYVGALKAAALLRKQVAKKEFESWNEAKKDRAQALKCLAALEAPARMRGSAAKVLAYWRRVGALLKAVDASLLRDWVEWSRLRSDQSAGVHAGEALNVDATVLRNDAPHRSNDAFEWAHTLGLNCSPSTANALWCALAPRGCDVQRHASCGGVSALRSALLKVLKSGLDFGQAIQRLERARLEDGGGGGVSPKDLRLLLRIGGLVVSSDEARLIVDCLDNFGGSGGAPLERVRSFFGSPTKPGDVQRKLKTVCFFQTTCPETGMPNAFRVIKPGPKRPGDGECDVTLADQSVRRRWINPELAQRREVLSQLGLAKDGAFRPHSLEDDLRSAGLADKGPCSGDDYDDDFGPEAPTTFAREVYAAWFDRAPCSASCVSRWGSRDRKLALKALKAVSHDARRESMLRTVLSAGSPPAKPDVWAASLADLEAEGVARCALLTRLVVRWRPGAEAQVAFFSLEFSGALGSKAQRENTFREVARDPPSAKAEAFAFQHVVAGLEPQTTYVFRVRGFNAFGPGPYQWAQLTTPPAPPMRPVPVAVGSRSVSLRWTVPDSLEHVAFELKASFLEACEAEARNASRRSMEFLKGDAVGLDGQMPEAELCVLRKKWLEHLEARHPKSYDFLHRANAANFNNADAAHLEPGRVSLLDEIQASDVATLSWKWLRSRLAATSHVSGSDSVLKGEASRMIQSALDLAEARPFSTEAAATHRFQQLAAPTTYILEKCLSEKRGQYEEVLRTRFGEAQVNGLDADACRNGALLGRVPLAKNGRCPGKRPSPPKRSSSDFAPQSISRHGSSASRGWLARGAFGKRRSVFTRGCEARVSKGTAPLTRALLLKRRR